MKVTYRLWGIVLIEPIFMAGPKPMRTDFGIHQRLESCGPDQKNNHDCDWPPFSHKKEASLKQVVQHKCCPLCVGGIETRNHDLSYGLHVSS